MINHDYLTIPAAIASWPENLLLFLVSSLLVAICIKLLFSKKIIEVIIYLSIFSVLISLCYLILNAPDVAMTEVSIGACLSTCILLNFLKHLRESQTKLLNSRLMISSLVCVAFIASLLWIGFYLPQYGQVDSNFQTHINQYYLQHTHEDIGAPSFVAALLASYRGFDTLGETSVILIAAIAVLAILSNKADGIDIPAAIHTALGVNIKNNQIIKLVTFFIAPFILNYGIYVQINGEISPGGGFQAGIIFASVIIAIDMISEKSPFKNITKDALIKLAAIGVLIYGGVGVISLLYGDNFLDYNSLNNNKHAAQLLGIFLVEIGVGICVSSVMCLLYYMFE